MGTTQQLLLKLFFLSCPIIYKISKTKLIQGIGRHASVFQAEVHAIELYGRENVLGILKYTKYLYHNIHGQYLYNRVVAVDWLKKEVQKQSKYNLKYQLDPKP